MCVFNTGSGCLSSTCTSGQAVKALSLSDAGDMIRIRFSKGRAHDDTDDRRVCKCQGEDASPWALCVCVSVPWANKLHEGKLRSTCPYCRARTHPHSHTFPLSTQHPILSKDEEKGQALHEPKAAHSNKDGKPSVFSLTKPWYVPQSYWGPLCAATFVVSCLSRLMIIMMMMMMVMMTAMAVA